uniref:Uncharacterized protein n=1 Tax=Angiostrongylus cantonensis TaxID=6313 RepID=A0A0K0DCS9_ANGCA
MGVSGSVGGEASGNKREWRRGDWELVRVLEERKLGVVKWADHVVSSSDTCPNINEDEWHVDEMATKQRKEIHLQLM